MPKLKNESAASVVVVGVVCYFEVGVAEAVACKCVQVEKRPQATNMELWKYFLQLWSISLLYISKYNFFYNQIVQL